MLSAVVIFAVLVVAGHVALGVFLNNRLHAKGWPRTPTKLLSAASLAVTFLGAPIVAWCCVVTLPVIRPAVSPVWFLAAYGVACGLIALGPLPLSLWRRRTYRPPKALLSNHSTVIDLSQGEAAAGLVGRSWRQWLVRLPGNESLRIEVNEKR